MKIAIVGAYGSGKTTLATALRAKWGVESSLLPPMGGPAGASARPAVECDAAELAEVLVRRLMDRCSQEATGPDVVSDGSLLHDWVFARTLVTHGARPADGGIPVPWQDAGPLDPVARAARSRFAGRYDAVFHLPVEFAMTEPAPPVSEEFRRISDGYLLAELKALQVPVITVVGALQERIEQVRRVVDPVWSR